MPKIVGKVVTVVEHGGMKIEELAGNVASHDDTLSIAHVKVSEATAEPWLTLKYDEWICCLRGCIELHYYCSAYERNANSNGDDAAPENPQVLKVRQGETCFIAEGERIRPVFPQAGIEYIAVCLPAFKPERCIREEAEVEAADGVSDVATKLRELHSSGAGGGAKSTADGAADDDDTLYHMCQKFLWDQAVSSGDAYFPPTFHQDGGFTHATAVPARLIATANHFYAGTDGDWTCLELSKSALQGLGIVTRFEEPKAVGTVQTDKNEWNEWRCPHIFGGIPAQVPGVLKRTFPMKRDETGNFLCIEGLTDSA